VLANNTASSIARQNIEFPIDFKWPVSDEQHQLINNHSTLNTVPFIFLQGTFSLIIEAWHESNNKSLGKKTI
jgi:hypothetical protein